MVRSSSVVRGVAMNPIDHPHGVVKVKLPGRPSVSPYARLKGYPTVRKTFFYHRTRRKAKELKLKLLYNLSYYEISLKVKLQILVLSSFFCSFLSTVILLILIKVTKKSKMKMANFHTFTFSYYSSILLSINV